MPTAVLDLISNLERRKYLQPKGLQKLSQLPEILKNVFISILGDVSAIRFKTNQIRKSPEILAGIHNKTNRSPTIDAQFKEALTIKKEGFIRLC